MNLKPNILLLFLFLIGSATSYSYGQSKKKTTAPIQEITQYQDLLNLLKIDRKKHPKYTNETQGIVNQIDTIVSPTKLTKRRLRKIVTKNGNLLILARESNAETDRRGSWIQIWHPDSLAQSFRSTAQYRRDDSVFYGHLLEIFPESDSADLVPLFAEHYPYFLNEGDTAAMVQQLIEYKLFPTIWDQSSRDSITQEWHDHLNWVITDAQKQKIDATFLENLSNNSTETVFAIHRCPPPDDGWITEENFHKVIVPALKKQTRFLVRKKLLK